MGASVLSNLWGPLLAGASFDAVKKQASDIVAEGYDMSELLCRIHDDVVSLQAFSDLDKALICEKIAQVINSSVSLLRTSSSRLMYFTGRPVSS